MWVCHMAKSDIIKHYCWCWALFWVNSLLYMYMYLIGVLHHSYDKSDKNIVYLLASGRVDGNKKGVLTRQREPKASARLMRARYHSLAQGVQLCYNTTLVGHYASYCPTPKS